MGISFAKSIKFGAVRFNFSSGGIGVSVGVPGLRIGTGPRGAYVSGGMGGFRYRKSLDKSSSTPRLSGQKRFMQPSYPDQNTTPSTDPNVVASVEHETKNVLELADASGDDLLQSMNEQRNKASLWPFVAAGLAILLFILKSNSENWNPVVVPTLIIVFAILILWVRWHDNLGKLTVLFFDPDEETNALFKTLSSAVQNASNTRKLRSVANTSQYADSKYSAGASQGLKLVNASFYLGQAPGIVSNIVVPILTASKTTLAFYPDRVLAIQGKSVGAIAYKDLQAISRPSLFIEKESLPSDATVVDHTWEYVNKKGGPDKRFKDNRQLPVCQYNNLQIYTASGIDIRFMGSRAKGFDPLAQAIDIVRNQR